MAKKNMSRIAAIALAGATVISTIGMTVSALDVTDGKATGAIYQAVVKETLPNGATQTTTTYYTNKDKAPAGATVTTIADITSVKEFKAGTTIYLNNDGSITTTDNGSTAYKTVATSTNSGSTGSISAPSSSYRYASEYVYLSAATGTYYPNLKALQAAEGVGVTYTTYKPSLSYSSTNCYFDPEVGLYFSYANSENAYKVSSSVSYSYSTPASAYRYPSSYSYYSYETGMYYPNLAALQSVEGSNVNYKTVKPATGYSSIYSYFNPNTGSYTTTATTSASYSTDYKYYDYYYGNGYYYNYLDPYSYYYWLRNDSSSKDTTTATLGKRTGWTSIAKYLKTISSGSSVTIDMNKETVIPSSVMSAIKGRNVKVKFVLDNGVIFTVVGKDVTTAKDVDVDTTYNTKSISSKLIKSAYKKNDAVSSAQLSIDAGTLGFSSDLTVKFSAKRGGYKAKLYRYNAAKNSLQLVDSATISSTGSCTFDKVTKGGEFVIVIYK